MNTAGEQLNALHASIDIMWERAAAGVVTDDEARAHEDTTRKEIAAIRWALVNG